MMDGISYAAKHHWVSGRIQTPRTSPTGWSAIIVAAVADSRVDKWLKWCRTRIQPEVLTMYTHRDTFQTVHRIVEANGQLPDSYFWVLRDTYATTQAVAIRRQVESQEGVATPGRLLTELSEDAPRPTREVYIDRWDIPAEPVNRLQHTGWPVDERELRLAEANRAFDERFAGCVGDHLNPAIPAADLERLKAAARRVKTYVDKHLAHSDAKRKDRLPTFGDVDGAVDMIGRIFNKYAGLLTASTWWTLVPVHQDDWLGVFRQAWIRRDMDF